MAMTVREIRKWLKDLKPTDRVGVNDGGLCLAVVGNVEEQWLEIGGLPTDDDEAEPRRVALNFHGSVVVTLNLDGHEILEEG